MGREASDVPVYEANLVNGEGQTTELLINTNTLSRMSFPIF